MIYNDLQEAILALLSQPDRSPEEALQPLIEEHQSDPDVYSRLVAAILNIEMDELTARERWADLITHHATMHQAAGRRLDFRVAAMDYLLLNPEIIGSPTIVDESMLRLTQRLAAIDELTGLFNRRFLETYLTKELNRAKRYAQVFSLLFLDLDDFKQINDSYGHAAGDKVLSALGRQITDLLRHEDFAARYGGEEFVVVLPQTTVDGAVSFGERLREVVAGLELIPDAVVTFSAGAAAYPRHGLSADELLQHADAALYEAKLSGKDQVIVSNADKRASTRYFADFPAVMGSAAGPRFVSGGRASSSSRACNTVAESGTTSISVTAAPDGRTRVHRTHTEEYKPRARFRTRTHNSLKPLCRRHLRHTPALGRRHKHHTFV